MLHVHPIRAFFHPGERIQLYVKLDSPAQVTVKAMVYHLDTCVTTWETVIVGEGFIETDVSAGASKGYLVRVAAGDQQAFTAFDVLENWTQAPRYGYVYDFSSQRSSDDIAATLDHLLRLHINGLQFYDWQYRHDTLMPPQDEFVDPLGRRLSIGTVRRLIEAAHQRGMAAMPYTAIYAASPSFAAAHPDWELYDGQGQVVDFAGGFLKLMNMSSGWQQHFVAECEKVLAALPFDGIHVDQYGEPRTGTDANGKPVDIAAGFAETLTALRAAVPAEKVLLFNLVHNWPVETIANSPLDFWYSELWPPVTTLTQLWETIRDNRRLNPRPAVIAVYIPPDWEATVLAAHSTMLAAGGSHIAHGEHGSYLSDPYFPKAGMPSTTLSLQLQQLADFAVAYENALVFAEDVTDAWIERITINGEVWQAERLIVKQAGKRLFINILPTQGRWDEQLAPPDATTEYNLKIDIQDMKSMWCASPQSPLPQHLSNLKLPPIWYWLLVCIEHEDS
jgi:dextranase